MAVRTIPRLNLFCCMLDTSNFSAPPVTLIMRFGCGSFHTSSSNSRIFFITASFWSSVPSVGKPTRTYFAVFFEVFEKRNSPKALVGASRVCSSLDRHTVAEGRLVSEWRSSPSPTSMVLPHTQKPLRIEYTYHVFSTQTKILFSISKLQFIHNLTV